MDKKAILNRIKMEALDLKVSQERRTECPFCEAKERSFKIARIEEGLLYNCFRASCGERGFVSSLPGSRPPEYKEKPKYKIFTRPLIELPPHLIAWLGVKYGLTEEEINDNGFKYDYTEHRLYMPIFDKRGYEVGAVSKLINKRSTGIKAISYWFGDATGLHYPAQEGRESEPVVVVEDILSAVCVSRFAKVVAILGSNITDRMAEELQKQTDSIILALDPDAISKAMGMRQKYSLYFRNFQVVYLSNDPKDLPEDQLKKELGL